MSVLPYICLLRGINVAGRNIISMNTLVKLCEKAGFEDVQSYLQSGNLTLSSTLSTPDDVAQRLAGAIRTSLKKEVSVIVRTPREMKAVCSANPYAQEAASDPAKVLVTFLAATPDANARKRFAQVSFPGEFVTLMKREVYLHVPGGYGRAKLNNVYIERVLGVFATTRNMRTVEALTQIE